MKYLSGSGLSRKVTLIPQKKPGGVQFRVWCGGPCCHQCPGSFCCPVPSRTACWHCLLASIWLPWLRHHILPKHFQIGRNTDKRKGVYLYLRVIVLRSPAEELFMRPDGRIGSMAMPGAKEVGASSHLAGGVSCPEQLGVPAAAIGLGIFLPVPALISALMFPASTSGNRTVALPHSLVAGCGCVTSGAEKYEQRSMCHSLEHL